MTQQAVGHVLLVVGWLVLAVWALADAADGWTRVRTIGRVVNVLTGLLTRPLTTLVRRRRRRNEPPSATCARRGHDVAWDGHAEFCRRCGVDSYPELELPDPTVRPSPLRMNVDLTDEEVEGLINKLGEVIGAQDRDVVAVELERSRVKIARRLDELRPHRRS